MAHSERILLVGDEPGVRSALGTARDAHGGPFTVETAADAADAVDRLADRRYACVVAGDDLPEGDGLSLLATVREDYPELPLVLLASDGDEVGHAGEGGHVGEGGYADGDGSGHESGYADGDDRDDVAREGLVARVAAALSDALDGDGEGHGADRDDRLLDAMPGCVVELDAEGRFVYANRRAKDVLGLDRSAVTDRSYDDPEWQIRDLSGEPIPDEELPFQQVLESGEPLDGYEHAIRWPDDSRAVLSINGVPLFGDDGDVDGVVFSLTDITDRKRREAELERFERIVERLDDIATIVQPDGTITYVSPAVERVLGFERSELVGENALESQPPETRESVDEAVEAVLAEPDEPRTVQTRFRSADGSPVWVESTLHNRLDDDVIDGILVSSREIEARVGQRERAQRRERQLSALHEATRELVSAETPAEAARLASDAATEVLDLPFNGVHFYDEAAGGLVPVYVSAGIERVIDEVPVIDEGLAWEAFEEGETRVCHDLESASDVLNMETPIRSEMYLPLSDTGVFLVSSTETDAFDETDIECAQVLAANAGAALDRLTAQQQLRSREAELERQNERLGEFASVVSHDLRNPLSVAQGRLELTERDGDDDLEAAVRALDRMESLIDDLLALARQGDAVDELEPVEIGDLARSCWQHVAAPEATVAVETERTVRADRSRLKQLLENLMRNAVEHGGPGVTVTVADRSDGFAVADDGPGIPDSERDQVFEAGHSTNAEGTGFGLAIVERVAQAHGWTVDVTESEAGGARFEFTDVEDAA